MISIGLQKGDRVGILSKNSIEHLALFYACGRIGLIAQPMNWRLSSSEVIKIIENGNPSIVIVDSDLSELGKQVQAETDLVDRWFEYGETGDQSFESLVQAHHRLILHQHQTTKLRIHFLFSTQVEQPENQKVLFTLMKAFGTECKIRLWLNV
ncbi:MAG: hypothetical protein Ct9H90mP30_5680 [Actinomycetota bacterium]|nr:MAG: hypothetical protein Ct9H90mP30_5680 [Actinomycetota bacterium]